MRHFLALAFPFHGLTIQSSLDFCENGRLETPRLSQDIIGQKMKIRQGSEFGEIEGLVHYVLVACQNSFTDEPASSQKLFMNSHWKKSFCFAKVEQQFVGVMSARAGVEPTSERGRGSPFSIFSFFGGSMTKPKVRHAYYSCSEKASNFLLELGNSKCFTDFLRATIVQPTFLFWLLVASILCFAASRLQLQV